MVSINLLVTDSLWADIEADEADIIWESEDIVRHDWNFPISDKAQNVILLSLETLDCDLSEYLMWWGARPSKKSVYKLNDKTHQLSMKCSHHNAIVILHFISRLQNDLLNVDADMKKILNHYAFK